MESSAMERHLLRGGSMLSAPSPPMAPPDGGTDFSNAVGRTASQISASGTHHGPSFVEVDLGSFAEGLETWRPSPSLGSFQARTEAAFAPTAAPNVAGPGATYNGPQPLPKGRPPCPVQ